MAERVYERHCGGKVLCRLMRPGESLPFAVEQMGWPAEQLETSTVFVAEKEGQICGLVIAANVHGTLLLMRMLGFGGEWVRPLFRYIRLVCLQRKIAGVWMWTENQSQAEQRLLRLLPHFVDASDSRTQQTVLFAGRWGNNASNARSTVADTTVDRNRDRGDGGDQRLRTEQGLGEQQYLAAGSDDPGRPAEGSAGGTAALGGPGEPGQHAIPDGRQPDADWISDAIGQGNGNAGSRPAIHAAVYGRRR